MYTQNFWEVHGIFFIIFMIFFPRLTLLFSSVASGGCLWWIGLVICPRLLVAILATIHYWETNPILVIFAWLMALGGESTEKTVAKKKVVRRE